MWMTRLVKALVVIGLFSGLMLILGLCLALWKFILFA